MPGIMQDFPTLLFLALQDAVYAAVCQLPHGRARAIKLAQMVAARLGGENFGEQMLRDHLRSFESKVVPIGKLQLGVCR